VDTDAISDKTNPAGQDLGLPLISIIIPCYNHSRFLRDSIVSARAQTYRPVEVIVVDDGSTDNTSQIAADYPDVRCLRQRNQGPSAARNTGLQASRGRYVVFLDADDRLLPTALEVGLGSLKDHPSCAFVFGHCRLIGEDGSDLPTRNQPYIEKEHYLALLGENFIWTPGSVIYRRETFNTVGGFDPAVNAAADYELYLRIARRFPIHCHGEVVVEYRKHPGNMTRNAALMLTATLAVLRSQWKHVKGHKPSEDVFRDGLRSRRMHYGDRLIHDTVSLNASHRDWKRLLHGLILLLRYYPHGLARHLQLKLRALTGSAVKKSAMP